MQVPEHTPWGESTPQGKAEKMQPRNVRTLSGKKGFVRVGTSAGQGPGSPNLLQIHKVRMRPGEASALSYTKASALPFVRMGVVRTRTCKNEFTLVRWGFVASRVALRVKETVGRHPP